MEIRGIYGWLYNKCDLLMKLAYLNILWIIFTALGLVIFGLFPATTAMFSVTRAWAMGNQDCPIFKTFISIYRREFWKSHIIGIMMMFIFLVFYMDFKFFSKFSTLLGKTGWFFVFGFLILVMGAFLFAFPVFVHFKFTLKGYIKNTFFISLLHPFFSVFMLLGVFLLSLIIYKFQVLIFFYSGSVISYWITWLAHHVFKKIEEKQVIAAINR